LLHAFGYVFIYLMWKISGAIIRKNNRIS
jgi:hypothetical protein